MSDTVGSTVDQGTMGIALATLDDKGKAPESRMANASFAWQLFKRMWDADTIRSQKRAIMQGLIDGNPPWTAAEMERVGQAWRNNMNPREAEAIRDSRKSSYYGLLADVDAYVDVSLNPSVLKDYPQYQDTASQDYGEIIAEEHVRLCTLHWDDFLYEMFQHQDQMTTWGVGNIYFPNIWDWRFKSVRIGQMLVPDEALAKIGDFELTMFRDHFRTHDLYDKIRTPEREKSAREAGWDVDLIKRILMESVSMDTSKDRFQMGDWESWQQQYQNAEYYYSYSTVVKIRVVHCFFKEFSGKITHCIISENETYNNMAPADGRVPQQNGYIFQAIEQRESWQESIHLFFLNHGNGTYHGVRGLAHKIYAICFTNMKLLNSALDAGELGGVPMLQGNNAAHKGAMAISKFGSFAILQEGYNVIQQTSFRPDLTGMMGMKNMLDGILDRNIGLFRPSVTEEDKSGQEAQTLQAIKGQGYKEAKLEGGDIALYYFQLTPMWREQIRRLLNPKLRKEDPGGKEAFAFREACEARGVPKEWLKIENLELKARPIIGPNSPMLRSLILGEVASLSPYYDEKGKHNAIRDKTVALVGPRHADRYIPKSNRDFIPSQEKSFASMENAILETSRPVVVGADQSHYEHSQIHLAPLLQIAQQFKDTGKIDLPAAHNLFQMFLQHEAGHLDYLKGDPARVKEFEKVYNLFMELQQLFQQLDKAFQKMQKEQQQQQQAQAEQMQEALSQSADPKAAALMAKVRFDAAIKAESAEKKQALAQYRTEAEQARRDMQAEHQIGIMDKQTDAQIAAMKRRSDAQ